MIILAALYGLIDHFVSKRLEYVALTRVPSTHSNPSFRSILTVGFFCSPVASLCSCEALTLVALEALRYDPCFLTMAVTSFSMFMSLI